MRHASAPLVSLPTLTLLAALVAGEPRALGSQQRVASPATGTVVGTVRDSTGGGPLPGAIVQLVSLAPDRAVLGSATSKADGSFTLPDVPAGRFMLGFLHERLDSLGLDAPVRTIAVKAGETLHVDLAMPPSRRMSVAACAPGNAGTGAALVGVVRDAASGAPVGDAVVQSAWTEFDLTRGAISRRHAGAFDTTRTDGAFALCGVPRGGSLVLRALRGNDTTAVIELEVPSSGLLRRTLYLGGTSGGRLQGQVRSERTGRPLGGVEVGIDRGPTTRTSPNGEWTLTGLPMGTRMLEVRGVGYYPGRVAVDVVPDARPIETALREFLAVLDTIRVTAARNRLKGTGFEERRHSAAGRYFTAADMLRFPVLETSDVFVRVPGMMVDRTMLGDTRVTMRGPFGRCVPSFYVDGAPMRNMSAEDINSFVNPDEVAGIEVYTGSYVPPQFQEGLSGCGSILIWTRPGENTARRWSARRRTLHGLAAILLGAGIGVLFANH